jgi:hypothetical protein
LCIRSNKGNFYQGIFKGFPLWAFLYYKIEVLRNAEEVFNDTFLERAKIAKFLNVPVEESFVYF